MTWSPIDIPDLTGKVAVITGGNAGIGRETARSLAEHNATVILAVRNLSKGKAAADEITQHHTNATVMALELDLSDLASVPNFAKAFQARFDRLDILVNNAGIYAGVAKDSVTNDGFAVMMATNHLGHFALTDALIETLIATPNSRVVALSSGAYSGGDLDPERFHTVEAAQKNAYANSKLANLLFALELQRKFMAAGVDSLSLAAGPGPTKSDGMKGAIASITIAPLRWLADKITDRLIASAAQGAWPILRAATDPRAAQGAYFAPGGFHNIWGAPEQVPLKDIARDEDLARAIWDRSSTLTGADFKPLTMRNTVSSETKGA